MAQTATFNSRLESTIVLVSDNGRGCSGGVEMMGVCFDRSNKLPGNLLHSPKVLSRGLRWIVYTHSRYVISQIKSPDQKSAAEFSRNPPRLEVATASTACFPPQIMIEYFLMV